LQTDNPSDLIPENITKTPCIIKANHDSSGGIFVYDKNQIDWENVQKGLEKRLKQNYYWSSREWQYKNIKPTIVVEKLLQDSQGNIPFDYKLHCFNGKVRMISVDSGRDTDKHFRNWYSRDWTREPYRWSSQKGQKFTDPSEEDIERPKTLEKMMELSEILAQPFAYVRVDWYEVDGKLYFGEITFHHDGGVFPILPKKWDKKLGTLLKHQPN
ncbi:MAG: ATP-grasp fold amidoligase family protein, partial [Pricia sp.]